MCAYVHACVDKKEVLILVCGTWKHCHSFIYIFIFQMHTKLQYMCTRVSGQGGHGPHTIFKSMFWPPNFWGQLAQVDSTETISQSYIHRNTYIHTRSHTTQRTSTGITSPPLESSTTVKPFTVTPKSAYNFIYD